MDIKCRLKIVIIVVKGEQHHAGRRNETKNRIKARLIVLAQMFFEKTDQEHPMTGSGFWSRKVRGTYDGYDSGTNRRGVENK